MNELIRRTRWSVPGPTPRFTLVLLLATVSITDARAQDGGLSGPSSVAAELTPGDGLTNPQFRTTIIRDALPAWFAWKDRLAANYNLKFTIDYLALGQWSNAAIGQGEASSGIGRLYGTWSPFKRQDGSTGRLTFKIENRHAYGDVAPQFFGFDSGALSITGTAFSDIGTALTNLYWTEKAGDGSWTLQFGQIDVTDFVDVYGLVSPYSAFQNLAFNTSPTINAPDPGLGIAGGVRLGEKFYVVGSIADANGDPTQPDFNVFETGETFKSVEIGYTSAPDRIYLDNIHLTFWQSDAADDGSRAEDYGVAFSAAWFFNNTWMPFMRAGISQGTAALYKASLSTGIGYYSSETDLVGIGLNWADPGSAFSDDQLTAEAFYRYTISPNIAVTPSVQWIINPALNPSQDSVAIFGIRSRVAL